MNKYYYMVVIYAVAFVLAIACLVALSSCGQDTRFAPACHINSTDTACIIP